MTISSNNRRIAKNAVYLYLRTFVVLIVSLFISRVVLQALGEVDYGIYNVVGGIVVLFAFLNTSLSVATQRFLTFELGKDNLEGVRKIFSTSIFAHFTIALVVLIACETVGLWLLNSKLNIPADRMTAAFWVFQFSVAGCCFQILRIPYNALVIAYEKMSFYAYASIIETFLKLLIAYVILYCGSDKLVFYSILMTAAILITNILYYIYCRRSFDGYRLRLVWDKKLYSRLMGFSGWSMLGSGTNVITNQGQSFIFNILCGVLLNTALGVVHQVTIAMTSFYSSFQTAFTPQLVKNYASENHSQFYSLLYRSSRFSYYLAILVALPLIVYCGPVLNLWLVKVPEYAVPFTQIMIAYCVIDSLASPLWTSVQACGNIRNYQITVSALTLLALPVTYVLLKLGISPVYAILAKLLLNVVIYFARLYFTHSLVSLNIREYYRHVLVKIMRVTALSSVAPLICMYYFTHGWAVLCGILSILVATFLIIVFTGLTSSERLFLRERVSCLFN